MRSLTETLNDMIEKSPTKELGVFVMSINNLDKFRKTHGFSGEFKGHKVRGMKQAPDDKIYLLGEEDYQQLKEAVKNPIKTIKNKDKNETIKETTQATEDA